MAKASPPSPKYKRREENPKEEGTNLLRQPEQLHQRQDAVEHITFGERLLKSSWKTKQDSMHKDLHGQIPEKQTGVHNLKNHVPLALMDTKELRRDKVKRKISMVEN